MSDIIYDFFFTVNQFIMKVRDVTSQNINFVFSVYVPTPWLSLRYF